MLDLHRIFGRRPRRSSAARTGLHVGIVLAMLGALFLVPVLAASAGGTSADLEVSSQTDTPDPVTGGNDVQYEFTVTNNGPDSVFDVQLQDTLDASVTFVSASPDEECVFNDEGQTVDCSLGVLSDGESVIIDIVVQAPAASETPITNLAEVGANFNSDPNSENDSSSEPTTVATQTEGEPVTGFIPPGGGTLTTDPGTGATPEDRTVLTEKFGPGPGGEASVQELDECSTDPDLLGCIGNIGDFQPPPGYDKVVAVLLYDYKATVGGGSGPRKNWKILWQKDDGPVVLSKCGPNPVANELIPCWKSIFRIPLGQPGARDLRARVYINSDPKIATRR
jgi:uncharacterized repeat protein (TIGR01451 family)